MTAPAPDPAELTRLRAAIPAGVRFGTSTWNYPGWRGLVYSRDYPEKGASAEMLADGSFELISLSGRCRIPTEFLKLRAYF